MTLLRHPSPIRHQVPSHNAIHVALLLHSAIDGWRKAINDDLAPLSFEGLLLVPALALHGPSARGVIGTKGKGQFARALAADDWAFAYGVGGRILRFGPATLRAMAIGHQAGLIKVLREPSLGAIILRKSVPPLYNTPLEQALPHLDAKDSMSAARSLGRSFGELGVARVYQLLGFEGVKA